MKTGARIKKAHSCERNKTMRTLGICCGASTISAVEMVREAKVAKVVSRAHDGNPKRVVAELLSFMEFESCDRMASTGTAA